MEQQQSAQSAGRDYSTISPSAKSLLLLKGYTKIPFAKAAAALISLPEKYEPDFSNTSLFFWGRLVHFERRYWSINQLLEGLAINQILEISSGFSFRGLSMSEKPGVHYIDTDLPELMQQKKAFVGELGDVVTGSGSQLQLLPLNALDEPAFKSVVAGFGPEPVAIINEGLLMYLGIPEKQKLCGIIRDVLREHGGYWITADIYVRGDYDQLNAQRGDELSEFIQQHRIRDNMFDSFEAAETFFREQGFVIDKEAETDREKITALEYLIRNASPEQLSEMGRMGKVQTTWRLKLAD